MSDHEIRLTRRGVLGSACALAATALRAQTPAAGSGYHEYARALPDYLSGVAGEAYARRNARIAGLRTAAAIRDGDPRRGISLAVRTRQRSFALEIQGVEPSVG